MFLNFLASLIKATYYCILSKEFRDILMLKIGNFDFENGSTESYGH